MDTESEADQADAYMEEEGPAPVAKWPPLDDASVARERERTERRQQRRAIDIESGERCLRDFKGNAGNRANARIDNFPPILTYDS